MDYRGVGVLLQRCADGGLLRQGRTLHARLVVHGANPDNYLASKLVTFYSRAGELADARSIFDGISHKNLFSWNAMLIAYAHDDRPLQAIQLFSLLASCTEPDAFSISSLLKSLASCSPLSPLPHLAKEAAHGSVVRHGFDSDLFVSNGLITVYARFDDLVSARKVFDGMFVRDIISWNSMISGFSQTGHFEDCLRLYEEMELGLDGVKPNGVTVVGVLHACSQVKDLIFGMRVHKFALESNVDMDVVLWNSVIGFYAKCGSLDYARRLFEGMPEKDAVSYGTMITGYMSYGLTDRAIELFRQMANPVLSTWNALIAGMCQNNQHSDALGLLLEMQASGFLPNSVTLSSVLPTLSFYSNFLGGKQVHCYAIRNDCDQNIYVSTALIDIYAKAGLLCDAQRVFDRNKTRSVIVWTAIISAYAAHGNAVAALALFARMLDAKLYPDTVTITAVLSACAHAGVVDEARRIFDAMLPEFGIQPAIEHYACMVGVLSRSRLLQEAIQFINKMPFEPNAKVWGALLNGAAVFGDVKLGRFVFDRLIEIEPENTGNYIVMANIYSRAGKWEEAEKVRKKMREVGLEKIPGCSWIEMSYGLQVFVARDTSNRCFGDIYVTLEGLAESIRDEGYVPGNELDEESFGT